MPRIRLYCNTGFAGCTHEEFIEVDDAEWDAMTIEEREKSLEEMAHTHMANHIDFGAYVVGDSDA